MPASDAALGNNDETAQGASIDTEQWTGPIPEGLEYFITVDDLPYATVDLEGIGGTLKVRCEDFVVRELMDDVVDENIKEGQSFHWWLLVRRIGKTTREVQEALRHKFGLKDYREIGVAGLKDKRAVVTQWVTIPSYSAGWKRQINETDLELLRDANLERLRVAKRRAKLRRGMHRGNEFEILLSNCGGAIDQAHRIAQRLEQTGVPNYFSQQRFGRGCSTAVRGARLLQGRKKLRLHNPVHSFCVEAFTSMLFNCWLAAQLESGTFFRESDLSGPLFGSDLKLRPAEAAILERADLPLTKFPDSGARRIAFFRPKHVRIERRGENDLLFTFQLRAGAYATAYLREFVKRPAFCCNADDNIQRARSLIQSTAA